MGAAQAREPVNAARPRVRAVDVAAVLWASFLAACMGSMIFFATVDPALLGDASPLLAGLDRESGYALLFSFFWMIAVIAGALSVYLVRGARAAEEPSAS
jgi:hypothetical protein